MGNEIIFIYTDFMKLTELKDLIKEYINEVSFRDEEERQSFEVFKRNKIDAKFEYYGGPLQLKFEDGTMMEIWPSKNIHDDEPELKFKINRK